MIIKYIGMDFIDALQNSDVKNGRFSQSELR